MIHRIEISAYDDELLQDLMDLADMEYSIDRKGYDKRYYIEGPTSKFRKILEILRSNGVRFTSTLD